MHSGYDTIDGGEISRRGSFGDRRKDEERENRIGMRVEPREDSHAK